MLGDFIAAHREEILSRAQLHVTKKGAEGAGAPVFLDQLHEALRKVSSLETLDHAELVESASQHGQELFHQGMTVEQVVHAYGQICQAITGLAVDKKASIDADEFQTLNLCLDDAIAGAVKAYSGQREAALSDEGTERLGVLAHEMRNALNAAMISFGSIKKGVVATSGSTSAMLDRSLIRMQLLIDRSLADVRLDAGIQNLERVPVCELIEEVEIGASLVAQTRMLEFSVISVDPTVMVRADRQILAAAIANLLQNAFKFTRPRSRVHLNVTTTTNRVLIEVEDECGGLPNGDTENLLRPFTQQGRNRTGLGLGLSICVKAARAIGGELRIRDLPGKGCVFTLDLPRE